MGLESRVVTIDLEEFCFFPCFAQMEPTINDVGGNFALTDTCYHHARTSAGQENVVCISVCGYGPEVLVQSLLFTLVMFNV